MSNEEDPVDEVFNQLLEIGALELIGVDETGEPVYRVTELCREIFPDLYYSHKKEVDDITFSLWQLGIVDISVGESQEEDSFSFNKHNLLKFYELEDTLTQEQIQVIDVFMSKDLRESARELLD